MKVKYDQAQDITFILDQEDIKRLCAEKRGKDFWRNAISAVCREADCKFYLAIESLDPLFGSVERLDGGVRMRLPEEVADPYLISLEREAYERLVSDRSFSTRYVGGSKLFFILKEEGT